MVDQNNVEMKDAEGQPNGTTTTEETPKEKDTEQQVYDDIREQITQINRAVSSKEPRFVLRVLRSLALTRRRLTPPITRKLINSLYPTGKDKEALLNYVEIIERESQMEVSETVQSTPKPKTKAGPSQILPETDVYINLLVLLQLIDNQQLEKAVKCSDDLMTKLCTQNRRTLDLLAARCYFYHSRVYELTNQLDKIRGFLHSRLRTSTLRNDFEGQAVLINCLLRNYLHYNLFDQADKLVSKCGGLPESAGNNEWARYLYYVGRIKAAQLDYTKAHTYLMQVLRKAPQNSAIGFKQTVQKLLVVVELLLGDIPERQVFRQAQLKKSLAPYLKLTRAVRNGDINLFNSVLKEFGAAFQKEDTFTLIIRLRHNVIKAALRKLALAYSRIRLSDVATKLQLKDIKDAEFIVAKAIRDGVIEAVLDHENGWMQSKETGDVYSTREPQLAFHQRIEFCLGLHKQSVKAMRFPPKSYHKDLESAEERREREQQDLELAKEMAEEDEDGFP